MTASELRGTGCAIAQSVKWSVVIAQGARPT